MVLGIFCATALPAAETPVESVGSFFEANSNPNFQYYGTRIVSDNATIHVVYYDGIDSRVHYNFSNTFGATWSGPLIVPTLQSQAPVIQTDGGANVFIAYLELINVPFPGPNVGNIHFIQGSTASVAGDVNITTSGPVPLGATASQAFMVALDLFRDANGILHLTWAAGATQATQQVYYSNSNDNGTTWAAPIQLSAAVAFAPNPRFITNPARTQAAVIWATGTGIDYIAFNAGSTATVASRLTFTDGGAQLDHPSGVIDPAGAIHLAYLLTGNTIRYAQVGAAPITLDAGAVAAPVMAYTALSQTPVVSWYKGVLGNTVGASDVWQASKTSATTFSTPTQVNTVANLGRHPFLNPTSGDDQLHYFYWSTPGVAGPFPGVGYGVYNFFADEVPPTQPTGLSVSYGYPNGICNTGNVSVIASVSALPPGASQIQFSLGTQVSGFQPGLSFTFTNVTRNQALALGVVAEDALGNIGATLNMNIVIPSVNASCNTFGQSLFSIPNPFSPATNYYPSVVGDPAGSAQLVLDMGSPQPGATVDFYVYNTHGVLLYRAQTLTNGANAIASVLWNGKGMNGEILGNGVYLLRAVVSTNSGKVYRGRLTILDRN